MKDPRLLEIELLAAIDETTYVGQGWTYSRPNPCGGDGRQVEDALFHLILEGAVVDTQGYHHTSGGSMSVVGGQRPRPSMPLDIAIERTSRVFLSASTIGLKITQRGRLRLYRLRDEILNKD